MPTARRVLTAAAAVSAVVVFGALPASAHTHSMNLACGQDHKAHLSATAAFYPSGSTGSLTVDGAKESIVWSGGGFGISRVLDGTKPHLAELAVTSPDDPTGSKGWTFKETQDAPACVPLATTPPVTTVPPPVTPPPTSTAPPETTPPATTVPPTSTVPPPTTSAPPPYTGTPPESLPPLLQPPAPQPPAAAQLPTTGTGLGPALIGSVLLAAGGAGTWFARRRRTD